MKMTVNLLLGLLMSLNMIGLSMQTVNASEAAPKLAPAQVVATNPEIQTGQKIIVVTKDTKNQTVSVYTNRAEKTDQCVKMGNKYTVQFVKNINGKKIVRIATDMWLRVDDVAQY